MRKVIPNSEEIEEVVKLKDIPSLSPIFVRDSGKGKIIGVVRHDSEEGWHVSLGRGIPKHRGFPSIDSLFSNLSAKYEFFVE